jgi:DNA polymerase III delta subunit
MKKVCVLEGNEAERKGVLDKIKSSLAEGFEIFYFDKEDTYDYVSQIITELSCFGERRLFIIKDLPKIDAPTKAQARSKVLNKFKKIFSSIPEGNIVVFNNVGLSAESFFKEVRKCGNIYKFPQKINKSDSKKIISSYFKKRNIEIDGEISLLIASSVNPDGDDIDVDKLSLILKKLHNYTYGKSSVNKEDVYTICSYSKEFVIWTLYNLLDEQSNSNEEKSFSSILTLISNYLDNAKYFQHEAVMMIRSMIWRYGLLLLAKNGVNNKLSQQEIVDKISNIKKLESTGRSYKIKLQPKLKEDKEMPEYSSKMIYSIMGGGYGKQSLACYTLNQLILIYYSLLKTLIKIRSGCTDAEIRISLQMNILIICGAITKKRTIDGILEYKKMLYGINNA